MTGLPLSLSQTLRQWPLIDWIRVRCVGDPMHAGPLKGNPLGIDWLYRVVVRAMPDRVAWEAPQLDAAVVRADCICLTLGALWPRIRLETCPTPDAVQ